MTLFLDIVTGKFRRLINSAPLPAVKFAAADITTLSITLTNGTTQVTTTELTGGKTLRAALNVYPSSQPALFDIALSTITGQVASGSINLSNSVVTSYFTRYVPAGNDTWEGVLSVRIVDGETSQTVTDFKGLMARDLLTVGVVTADFDPSDFSGTDFDTT